MIFKSTPNRVVQKAIRKQGKRQIVVWFKFDENGFAEINENKTSNADLVKLKGLFRVVDDRNDTHKVDGKTSMNELTYKELTKVAKEKGIKSFGIRKNDLIKLLEV